MKYLKYILTYCILFFSSNFAQNNFNLPKANEESLKSYPIDGTHLLEEKNKAVAEYLRNNPDALNPKLYKSQAWNFTVGTQRSFYADDFTNNSAPRYLTSFTCRAVGNHCYIFVEDSLWNIRVDQAAVDSVQKAFDLSTPANPNKGIYQMDVDAFGNPPDVDNDPKIVILILNIRDGYSGSGGYVAGYFYSYNELLNRSDSNKGEFFYLDANPLNLKSSSGIRTGMATTAHEFQHMINWNYQRTNYAYPTFVNESCSMVAELYCGYPAYSQSLYGNEPNKYLFTWRTGDNTLVLNDYSRAQRFSWYLWDQFGIGIFKYIVQSNVDTISLYNTALQQIGSSFTFNDVFKNWLIANSLNDQSVDISYGYKNPNMYKPKATIYYNPTASGGNTLDNLAGEYLTFSNGTDLKITFNSSSSNVVVKAIKIGSSNKQVVDVPLNSQFSVPDFGTTFTTVTFVVMNIDPSNDLNYTFTSTGTIPSAVQELKWDTTEPTGYLPLPAGDSVCVVFDPYPGAKLDSIRVALRQAGSIDGGVWQYSGVSAKPLGTKLTNKFTASISTTPSYPYPIPWPNWTKVDLQSYNIYTNNSFAVAFSISGTSPGVMITEVPGTDFYHSLSYSTQNSRWLYWTSQSSTTYIYLIRAYVSIVTSAGTKETVELTPSDFSLSQNYPNPFNPSTVINYTLAKSEFVSLKIYDLLGNEVATLVNEEKPAGSYNLDFQAHNFNLSSGTYFYRLQAGNFVETKKMILLK